MKQPVCEGFKMDIESFIPAWILLLSQHHTIGMDFTHIMQCVMWPMVSIEHSVCELPFIYHIDLCALVQSIRLSKVCVCVLGEGWKSIMRSYISSSNQMSTKPTNIYWHFPVNRSDFCSFPTEFGYALFSVFVVCSVCELSECMFFMISFLTSFISHLTEKTPTLHHLVSAFVNKSFWRKNYRL